MESKTTVLRFRKELKTYQMVAKMQEGPQEIRKGHCGLSASEGNAKSRYWLWHARFGHIGEKSLQNIFSKKLLDGLPTKQAIKEKDGTCRGCSEGRMLRTSFKSINQLKSERRLALIHSDVCCPMPAPSKGGSRYFVTFIDDYTRKKFVFFMASRNQVAENFSIFKNLLETEVGDKIRNFRSDNGGEYVNRY